MRSNTDFVDLPVSFREVWSAPCAAMAACVQQEVATAGRFTWALLRLRGRQRLLPTWPPAQPCDARTRRLLSRVIMWAEPYRPAPKGRRSFATRHARSAATRTSRRGPAQAPQRRGGTENQQSDLAPLRYRDISSIAHVTCQRHHRGLASRRRIRRSGARPGGAGKSREARREPPAVARFRSPCRGGSCRQAVLRKLLVDHH